MRRLQLRELFLHLIINQSKNIIMKFIKPALVTLLMLISVFSFAQKKVELKYNLPTGKEYSNHVKIVQTVAMEANGQSFDIDQVMSFFIGVGIVENYGDSIKLSQTINRVKMNQKVMGMDINYDSDSIDTSNPMAAQMHEAMKGILGKKIEQVIAASGKILRTDLGDLKDNPEFAKNMGALGQYMVYPEGKIKVGESFEQEVQQMVANGIRTKMKYTLAKIEDGIAIFNVEGTVTSEEGNQTGIQMEGKQTGTVSIGINTGWQLAGEIEQQMEMVVQQAGMSMPAQVQGKITFKSE